MTNYTKDAIDFAFENKLSDMQSAIQDAIRSKISDALEVKKFEVAQGMFGVSEAWGDDDEDDDVARADRELARMKAKPIKAAKGVDPEKDMTKLAKKTKEPEEVDEEVEDIQELSKDTLKSYVNKRQWDMGANEKAQKKMDTGLARAETKLKGDQHKLDKNKNGKVDSHDFKLLRKESEELEEIAKWRKGEPRVAFGGYDQEIKGETPTINKKATYALDKWSGQKIPLQKPGKDKEDELEGRQEISNKGYKTKKTLKTAIKTSLGKHGKSDLPEESEELEEKLSVSDGVQAWIKDFVDSNNPKFEGKSKKERTQMALGAFYAAKKGESTNEDVQDNDEGEYYVEKGGETKHTKRSSNLFHKSKEGKIRHIGTVISTKDGSNYVYPANHISHLPQPKFNHHEGSISHLIANDMKYLAKKQQNEEAEELEELSKKTLGSYIKKAASDINDRWENKPSKNEFMSNRRIDPEEEKHIRKVINRKKGINKAVDKF